MYEVSHVSWKQVLFSVHYTHRLCCQYRFRPSPLSLSSYSPHDPSARLFLIPSSAPCKHWPTYTCFQSHCLPIPALQLLCLFLWTLPVCCQLSLSIPLTCVSSIKNERFELFSVSCILILFYLSDDPDPRGPRGSTLNVAMTVCGSQTEVFCHPCTCMHHESTNEYQKWIRT